MIPTIWRFLLTQYLKVLALALVAFVFILLTTRLDEIAQFAALGAVSGQLWRYVLYQIPYILPIAIPISALISSLLLFQRLSHSYELTALRSCGYSLTAVSIPLLLLSGVLAIGNFYIISETATHSHLMKRVLKRELKAINPLVLLQNERLIRMKGLYVEAEGGMRSTEQLQKLIVATYNSKTEDIDLLLADEITSTPEALTGQGVTVITSIGSDESGATKLYIENAHTFESTTRDLSPLLGVGAWKPKDDHLSLSLLIHRKQSLTDKLAVTTDKSLQRKLKKQWNGTVSEIARRTSVSLAVLVFTLLGLSYGIVIGRKQAQNGLVHVVALSTLFLTCFFSAKALHHHLWAALALYLVPHLILITAACRRLSKISRGTAS